MGIQIKAKQTRQYVGTYAGQYRYQLVAENYNKLTEEKTIEEAALRSGYTKGAIKAVWDAAGEVLKSWLTEGHRVALPGIGTLRFSVNAKSVADVSDVSKELITSRKVLFIPNSDIREALKNMSISITCYDKDGNIVTNTKDSDNGTDAPVEG